MAKWHRYTVEQREFIVENVKGRTSKELADMVNSEFGLNLTPAQMRTYKQNNKLQSGVVTRFEKGQKSWNEGTKGVMKPNKTSFKAGGLPPTHKPVGSVRVGSDGYTWVKVAEPRVWKMKHVLIWEDQNGKVPDGCVVIFGDRDKSNMDIDNLILVDRKQLLTMNNNGLIKEDRDLTKTGVIIADIYNKVNEKKKTKGLK